EVGSSQNSSMPRGTWSEPGIHPSFWRSRTSRMSRSWTSPRASSAFSWSMVTFSMRCLASATSWPIGFRGVNMASPPSPVYLRACTRSRGPRARHLAHHPELHPVEQPAVEAHRAGEEENEDAGAVLRMEAAEQFERCGGDEARDGQPREAMAGGLLAPAACLRHGIAEQGEGAQ